MTEKTPSFNPLDLIFGVLDRIFKDANTGKLIFLRIFTVIVLFVLCLIWYKSDDIGQIYRDSKYETYSEIIQKEREIKFDTSALEQLQIVHVSSGADFSAIYSFRPKNLNYFVDLIAYEGTLPKSVSEKNLGGYPVDKTSAEYGTHLTAWYFSSTDEFAFLPTKKKVTDIKYMFSCPYFSLENVYSGTVSMYWYEGTDLKEPRLNSICQQAARTLGRAK